MSDSDRTDPPVDDSGEAGNYVEPVDSATGDGQEVGTDSATDKGDFTTSTDLGDGARARPNVDRTDGEYTTSQSNTDDGGGEGGYTDRDE